MIIKFYIIDVETGKYFYEYRLDEGFTGDINNAYEFTTHQSALDFLNESYHQEGILKGKTLEIKTFYHIP